MQNVTILSLASFLFAMITFAYAVFGGGINAKSLLDLHGLVIVIGGTLAATSIAFNPIHILSMLRAFYRGMLTGREIQYKFIVKEILRLGEAYRNNREDLRRQLPGIGDDFLREALTLVLDELAPDKEIVRILNERVDFLYERYMADAKKFKAIGKFPPAMGLMGAVLGMIGLLGGLGAPGAEKTVGPAMSMALVATFYGIALANLVIIPVGENLVERASIIKTKNIIIVAGMKFIMENTNPILLVEKLNSHLLPKDRLDWKAGG